MSTVEAVTQAAAAVKAALETPDLKGIFGVAYTDMGATVQTPALVIGPPALTWAGYSGAPSAARFLVYVIVDADDRAMERLWQLVPTVVAALENSDADISVPPGGPQANPGRWPAGTVDLPSYQLAIEVAL